MFNKNGKEKVGGVRKLATYINDSKREDYKESFAVSVEDNFYVSQVTLKIA